MTFRTYFPNSQLISQDEKTRDLFLVRNGKLEIHTSSTKNTALYILLPGDHIGDFQMIYGTSSAITVKAVVFTEVLVLNFEEFCSVLSEYLSSFMSVRMIKKNDAVLSRALAATLIAQKNFLTRFVKTQTILESSVKSKKMLMMMEKTETASNNFVILPGSPFRICWDILCLIVMLYGAIYVPIRVMDGFNCDAREYCLSSFHFTLFVDYTFDFLILVDAVLRGSVFAFRRFQDDNEILITELHDIYFEYAHSKRLFFSLVYLFPVDLFALKYKYIIVFRLTKLVSVFMFPYYMNDVQNFLLREKKFNLTSDIFSVVYLGNVVR